MKCSTMSYLVLAALAAAPAAAQEWEIFFDSKGFEELPLGTFEDSIPAWLPHQFWGASTLHSPLPSVVVPPAPAMGSRAVLLEPTFHAHWARASSVGYSHLDASFGRKYFSFPQPGGYRALRISFDFYHMRDPEPGMVWWLSGGIRQPWGAEPGEPHTVQIVWDETEHLEPVFDEWVHVSLTYDFERELVAGSYDGHESGFVPMPADLLEMEAWQFRVFTHSGDPPIPDIESVWLDNLVVEVIPPCPADCDVDYEHTFFDFLCFQNLFARGNNRADCDLDGELTFFDFVCFQDYFAAGCD